MPKLKPFTLKQLTLTAMAAAVAVVAEVFEVPFPPPFAFLKLNLADVPAILAAMTVSPLSGFLVVVLRCLIHMFRTTTIFVGETVNIVIGFGMVYGFCFVKYKRKGGERHYALAAVAGTVCTILFGYAANICFFPMYAAMFSMNIGSFTDYLINTITAMNAVRGAITFAFTALLIPAVKPLKRMLS
ncbi:MAG: ECF transporter S component [Oscillospiraceae bacterium]|jgi:riboflavin transporter FmnP|nr:ECF transporter S component [Oscillospiraceae bacterium]